MSGYIRFVCVWEGPNFNNNNYYYKFIINTIQKYIINGLWLIIMFLPYKVICYMQKDAPYLNKNSST
ncbi:hypothetical protein C1645_837931 [Glomus cerebriforme]|uniref:Uncharacterized protein n=1 Tax=Glomus cerebriforme TaxID=658196 RepID=A0A397S7Z9_9GLOM|nr:hypothetical protein C1645_837931 [Glomus cerebriforme]